MALPDSPQGKEDPQIISLLEGLATEEQKPYSSLKPWDFLRLAGIDPIIISECIAAAGSMQDRLGKAVDIGVLSNIQGHLWSYKGCPIVFAQVGGQRVGFYRSRGRGGAGKIGGK